MMPKSDNRMFTSIAKHYDTLNHAFSFCQDIYWRRQALGFCRNADKHKRLRILDVATGTGELAIDLARSFPNAEVIGVDINDEMLNAAKARKRLPMNVEFRKGDAEDLEYPDSHFDMVTSGFALRNFADLDAALKEMHRVVKRGGRMVLLDMERPNASVFAPLIKFYFFTAIPAMGGIATGNKKAYEFLPKSVWEFSEERVFRTVKRLPHADIFRKRMFGAFVDCVIK